MAFNNAIDANQQGTQYLSTAGAWSGVDASTAGFVLTSNGTGVAPNFQINTAAITVVLQVFTSTGTYTPTAGMKYCIIETVGGGGGGGGTGNSAAGFAAAAGGGGSGSYSRIVASAATIGVSQVVTIGAAGAAGASGNNTGGTGGVTSLGVICTSNGGVGGPGNPGNGSVNGGAGGAIGTGSLTLTGQSGGIGAIVGTASATVWTGLGGNSFYGSAAGGIVAVIPTTGPNGLNYGTGGGGGLTYNATGAAAGGTGSAGIIVITEYI